MSPNRRSNPYAQIVQDNEPDLQVEGWLKTLGIESLCQWDVLVFLNRHPSLLVSDEHLPRFLGYATGMVAAALDSLESSGLMERSRVSQGARLYELTAPADPARRDALKRLMTLAGSHTVRPLLARRLRAGDRPDQDQNDFPLHCVKG